MARPKVRQGGIDWVIYEGRKHGYVDVTCTRCSYSETIRAPSPLDVNHFENEHRDCEEVKMVNVVLCPDTSDGIHRQGEWADGTCGACKAYESYDGDAMRPMQAAIDAKSVYDGPAKGHRPEDQPLPIVNGQPFVHDAVARDVAARGELGKARYGTKLQPFNGRDALQDAYEELLDAACYIKQLMIERKANGGR